MSDLSVLADGSMPPRIIVASTASIPTDSTWTLTGSSGDTSWPVRGGSGVWAGEQVAMLDPMCPVESDVAYTLRWVTPAGAIGQQSAGPIRRHGVGSMLVTSLDGRRMVRVTVRGDDEQGESARIQRFDIPGSRRPVLRLDAVSGATGGTAEWSTRGGDTALLVALMQENRPLISLHDPTVCEIPGCDIPPVRLLMPLSNRRARSARRDAAWRDWQVPWLESDDPTPDQRVMPSIWDEFDAVGLTWDQLDALSLTWDQFDLMAWATFNPTA